MEPEALLKVMFDLLPKEDIQQLTKGLGLTKGAKLEEQLLEAIKDLASKAREQGLSTLVDAATKWPVRAANNKYFKDLLL